MSNPLVHVLVINWNGKEHLEACFDSLIHQTYANLRIVLVDNASTDDSVDFVRQRYGPDSRVEILECGANLGWSRGNNKGIERALGAGADYVFLLNNDTATAADAVEALVAFAEQHPRAGAIAPKMLLFDHPFLINSVGIACSIIGSAWDEGLGCADGPRWSEAKPVLGVCGGAMFLRAEALRKSGLLPDDFEIYLDDLDLCLRIWDAGFECWSCPSATVRHKFSATMGTPVRARRKYYLNTRNRLRLILRNFPSSRFPPVLFKYAFSEVRSIGRATLNGELWKSAAHAKCWFDAVGYIPKAIAHRRASQKSGQTIGRFWNLIRADARFFPGIPLPVRGWYAPRRVGGTEVRPISCVATADAIAGELSVTHANCYPHLGAAAVELRVNGRLVATLISEGAPRTECFAVEAGAIELVSRTVFSREATGEPHDIGGWVALDLPK